MTAALTLATACGGDKPGPGAARDGGAAAATTTPGDPATKPDGPADKPVAPLQRASAAAPGKAKGASQLGFDLALLSSLYALDGHAIAASWGAAGEGEPQAARDDDLGTAWRCVPVEGQPCAMGLSFAQPVSLRAVRLFAAAGPRWNDYRAHPRPKHVRVHTDAGWFDAKLDDGAAHHYVVLDASVKTTTVAIEVTDVYASKKPAALWFAELEAFGDDGPIRPPLAFDPARTVVSFETEAWKSDAGSHGIRVAFLEELGPDGALHRRTRGTAVHGRAGDRFAVIERRFGTDCVHGRGAYLLLDRTTRVMFPLGDKADVPATVTLRKDGLGALFVREGAPEHTRALVYENDAIVRHVPRTKKGETDAQFAARLGFTGVAEHRGAAKPGEAIAGCVSGVKEEALVQQVATALGLENLRAADASVCAIGTSERAVVGTDGAACGARWYAAVVGAGNEIVAQNLAGDGDGDGAEFTVIAGVGVVLEGSRGAGLSSDLWLLDPSGIEMLVKGGALAVREPKACRPCQPATPVEPGDTDTDGAVPTGSDGAPATDDGAPASDGGAPPDDDAAPGGSDGPPAHDDAAGKLPDVRDLPDPRRDDDEP